MKLLNSKPFCEGLFQIKNLIEDLFQIILHKTGNDMRKSDYI